MDSGFVAFLLVLFQLNCQAGKAPIAKFQLFTPGNDYPEVISDKNIGITFNSTLKTKFIVHGYMQNGNEKWIKTMRQELEKRENMNIIVVDWGQGSAWLYSSVVQNTRTVGSEIAQLIYSLHIRHTYDVSKIHVIGHSLGSHIAGFAGAEIKRRMKGNTLGRITGLDPASLSFNHNKNRGRLDRSDATFVDVIHTDIGLGGLGLARPCGHVDFYPNGGDKQPGCWTSGGWADINPNKVISNFLGFPLLWHLACDHMRVISIFTASINHNCPRKAYQCGSWGDFQKYKCQDEAWSVMGYDADKYYRGNRSSKSKYFLTTQGRDPFCGYNVYQVTLYNVTRGFKLFGGISEVQVFLVGKDGEAVSTLPSYKVGLRTKEIKITIATTINPGELSSIILKYAGDLPLVVRQVTVHGPRKTYFANYKGRILISPHDYSNGNYRYKQYKERLRTDSKAKRTSRRKSS